MRNRQSGFTLVEVIISITLIGIIAMGILPGFAAQLRMTVDGRRVTQEAFAGQSKMEDRIHGVRESLSSEEEDEKLPSDVKDLKTSDEFTIFGKRVSGMYRVEELLPQRAYTVYLSRSLAHDEKSTLLTVEGVKIEMSAGTSTNIVNLENKPVPTLKGVYNQTAAEEQKTWYKGLFRWYVSRAGVANPQFPADYEQLEREKQTLDGLEKWPNRYVIFSVIPVDIHGIRGNEVLSQRVFLKGPEWRAGIFAWVDKDEDGVFQATDKSQDFEAYKKDDVWKLFEPFDGSKKYLNPQDPGKQLDPSDGSLYVPMRVLGKHINAQQPGDTIEIDGVSKVLDWTLDQSINLAANIKVSREDPTGDGGNIHMVARDGDIMLRQDVSIDVNGKVVEENGTPKVITTGATLTTEHGAIYLKAEGAGSISLEKFNDMEAQKRIDMISAGSIHGVDLMLKASGTGSNEGVIMLDAAEPSSYTGNRDITLETAGISANEVYMTAKGNITLDNKNPSLQLSADRTIAFHKMMLTTTESAGQIRLNQAQLGDGIRTGDIVLNGNAIMTGGGWLGNLAIEEGKTITFVEKVENNGGLALGDTAGAVLQEGAELSNPLRLKLSGSIAGSAKNTVQLTTENYTRNLSYADVKTEEIKTEGVFQPLGSGKTNLEYTVKPVEGATPKGIYALQYSFDQGNITITVDKTNSAEEYSDFYTLMVRDTYAASAEGSILFEVRQEKGESPEVIVEPEDAYVAVAFYKDTDGTEMHANKSVQRGQALGADMPNAPKSAKGLGFVGWFEKGASEPFTKDTLVWKPISVYAKFEKLPDVQVTFDAYGRDGTWRNGYIAGTVYTRTAYQTLPQGNSFVDAGLDMPRADHRDRYTFAYWEDSNGIRYDQDTSILSNITLYAVYGNTCKVQFNRNIDATYREYAIRDVAQGNTLGTNMPSPPEREGYSFVEWRTGWQENQLGTVFDENTIVNSSIGVHARWSQTHYTVTFNNNYYNGGTKSVLVERNTNIGASMPEAPKRLGYRFIGWNTRQNGSGMLYTPSNVISSNLTLYAQWEGQKKVSFYLTASDTWYNNMDTVWVDAGSTIQRTDGATMPLNPTRQDERIWGVWYTYTFNGWHYEYWDQNWNWREAPFSDTTTVNDDTDVYATWTEKRR